MRNTPGFGFIFTAPLLIVACLIMVALLPATALAMPLDAPAATIRCVDDGGGATSAPCSNATAFTTIQAAVDVSAAGDEIRVAGGNYTSAGAAVVTVNKNLLIRGSFPGGSASNSWTNPGLTINSRVDGQEARPGFALVGAITLRLDRLSIENGGVSNPSGTLRLEQDATVQLNGGTSNGNFVLDFDARLQFVNGSNTVADGASLADGTSFSGEGFVEIRSGVVTIVGTVSAARLILRDSGDLSGAGTLDVTDEFDWFSGTMSGGGVTNILPDATMLIDNANSRSISNYTLNNSGVATWALLSGGNISIEQGGTINNLAGATFDLQCDCLMNGSGNFNNAGTIRKTDGTGQTEISLGFGAGFNNSGTVQVKIGTLRIADGSSTGLFTVATDATLAFRTINGASHNLSASSNISGPGNVIFDGGPVNINGAYSPGGTTTIAGGVVSFNSGPHTLNTLILKSEGQLRGSAIINVTTAFNWQSANLLDNGVLNILPSATMTIDNASIRSINGHTLNNSGNAIWAANGGTIVFDATATINNLAGATFDIQCSCFMTGSGIFNNAGTLSKTTTAGIAEIGLAFNTGSFNNSGSVTVQVGILSIAAGTSSGDFTVLGDTTLRFTSINSSTHNLSAASNVSGLGSVIISGLLNIDGGFSPGGTVTIDGGSARFNAGPYTLSTLILKPFGELRGSATVNVTTSFNWQSGSLLNGGVLNILSSATMTLNTINSRSIGNYTLNNSGAATWVANSGDIVMFAGGTINNLAGATFDMQCDCSMADSGLFNNAGTLRKSAGTGTTIIRLELPGGFNNSGLVEVQTGVLQFDGQYNQSTGTMLLNGGSFATVNTLNIAGGVLKGNGTITGDVNNSGGTVSLDVSPGAITIDGHYTQGSAGTLAVEILADGGQHDILTVFGAVTLAGSINVTFLGEVNFTPGSGFVVMTFASRTGTIDTVENGDLGNGLSIIAQNNDTDVTLVVVDPATATTTITPTRTATRTSTATRTATRTATLVPSATRTATRVATSVPTATRTATGTATKTATATSTVAPTATFTPVPGDRPPVVTVPLNRPYRVGVEVGNYLALRFDATDPDSGDTVILSVLDLPPGASLPIPAAGNPVFSTLTWRTTAADIGTYFVTVRATDSHGAVGSAVVQIDVVPGCVPYFSDVLTSQYFHEPVRYLFCQLVVSGYTEIDQTFTFRPFNNTTRSQFSKMISLAYHLPSYDPTTPDFSDVPTSNPFYSYIESAFHAGIISGYEDGTFRPFASITRGQLSKLIVNAAGWPITTSGGPHFSDVGSSSTFYAVIETAYSHGVISGYNCGGADEQCDAQNHPYFRPFNPAIRGQIAKILWQALGSPPTK